MSAFSMKGPPKPQVMKPMALGLHGPWKIDPGNPMFPNHRPFLSNNKPPSEVTPPALQKLPGGK